jgi:hypothetical protein
MPSFFSRSLILARSGLINTLGAFGRPINTGFKYRPTYL